MARNRFRYILVTLILAFCFICRVVPASAESADASAAKERMLALWSDYLSIIERQSSVRLWAYSRMVKFLESNDWRDLSSARSACISAVEYLRELQEEAAALKPLSDEDCRALNQVEVDHSYIASELAACVWNIEDARIMLEDGYLVCLEKLDCLTESDQHILSGFLAVDCNTIQLENEYLSNTTNYLLTLLCDSETAETFWKEIPERYPTVFVQRGLWLENEEALLARTDEILDRMELVKEAQAKIDAAITAQELEEDALAAPIGSLPRLLPAPGWYNPKNAVICNFYMLEDGTYGLLPVNTELPEKPAKVFFIQVNVEEEAYRAYLEQMQEQRYDLRQIDDSWAIIMPTYKVLLSYDSGKVTVRFYDEDITFAPKWLMENAAS